MVSLASFLTSFITSFAIFVVLVIAFLILRRRRANWPIFFPRRILAGEGGPASSYLGPWNWFRTTLFTSEEELIREAGLDAVTYLLFLRTCMWLLIYSSYYCLPVLLPVAITGQYIPDYNSQQPDDKKKLVDNGLDRLAMGNIPPKSDRIWAYAVGAYIIAFMSYHLLYSAYRHIGYLRSRYQQDTDSGVVHPELYTVLLRDVPSPTTKGAALHPSKKGVLSLFAPSLSDKPLLRLGRKREEKLTPEPIGTFLERVYGGDTLGYEPVMRLGKLTKIWKKLVTARKHLEQAEAKLVKNQAKGVVDRPQHKTGFLGLCGSKADSIDFYAHQVSDLTQQLSVSQEEANSEGVGAVLVFFKSRRAAAYASQTVLTDEADRWQVQQAPAPSEVCWPNLGVHYMQRNMRSLAVYAVMFLTVCFYMVPISFVSSITTLDNLKKTVTFLKPIVEIAALKTFLQAFLPQLALILFLALLPSLCVFFSTLEGLASNAHIERAACGKYFYFTVFNVFLGVTLTGSLFSSLQQVIDKPSNAINLLASSLPGNATFFITFLALKFLVGFGMELLRLVPLILFFLKKKYLAHTQSALNATWTPGPFSYVQALPNDLLAITLALCYAVIAPLILPFGVAYFVLAWCVYKNQFMNVYVAEYESRGRMWPHMHARAIAALILSQVTMLGYFGIKKFTGTVILIPLPFLTLGYYFAARSRLYRSFCCPSLDSATQDLQDQPPVLETLKEAYTPEMMKNGDRAMEEDERIACLQGAPKIGEGGEGMQPAAV